MDAGGCDEEDQEEELKGAEGGVGCDEEGWGGAWGEDGFPEVNEEVGHSCGTCWCFFESDATRRRRRAVESGSLLVAA